MNKPGGAAWVLSVHHHPADLAAGTIATVYYDVKYVLNGNSDVSVHCSFVRPVQELSRGSRKRGLDLGPAPASISAPSLAVKMKGRRKIAVSKSAKAISKECTKQDGDSFASGSNSKGSRKKVPHLDEVLEHSTLSKKDGNQSGKSALGEDKGRDGCSPSSLSVSGLSSQSARSICISHTSLENTDVLKLEKFIQKFSSMLHDRSCPSSSSSSSSSPRPVSLQSPMDVCRKTPTQSSCTLTDNFDSSITHLVVSVDKKGLLRKRTLKFMQAIMGTTLSCASVLLLPFLFLMPYRCLLVFVLTVLIWLDSPLKENAVVAILVLLM
jgi:hypothetical protein